MIVRSVINSKNRYYGFFIFLGRLYIYIYKLDSTYVGSSFFILIGGANVEGNQYGKGT